MIVAAEAGSIHMSSASDVGSAAVKHGREARAHQDARPDATCVGRTRSVDVDEYCTLAGPEVTRRSKLGK